MEGYTGEGEPPCIVMTLRTVSDETTPPDLSLPVTLSGVREQSKELQIHRPAGNVISAKLMHVYLTDMACVSVVPIST